MKKKINLFLYFFLIFFFYWKRKLISFIYYMDIYYFACVWVIMYGMRVSITTMVMVVKVVHALETETRHSLHVSYLMNVLRRRAYLFSPYVPILARVRKLSFIFLSLTLRVSTELGFISFDFYIFLLTLIIYRRQKSHHIWHVIEAYVIIVYVYVVFKNIIKSQTKLSLGKSILYDMTAWYDYQFFYYCGFRAGNECLVFDFLNLIETAQFHTDNRNIPVREGGERERKRGISIVWHKSFPARVDSFNKPKFSRKAIFIEKIYHS